jgi:predicted RNase H-like nuclease (RuvC/YqgF family)
VADHADGKPPAEALKECEKKVEHLKEENAVLRHSSEAFGDLAERLNQKHKALEAKRRPRKRRRMAGKARKTVKG